MDDITREALMATERIPKTYASVAFSPIEAAPQKTSVPVVAETRVVHTGHEVVESIDDTVDNLVAPSTPMVPFNTFVTPPPTMIRHLAPHPPPMFNTTPSMYMCRGCNSFPRRVAFLPCNHLALCSNCGDMHFKSRAPCLICGAVVVQRVVYFLE